MEICFAGVSFFPVDVNCELTIKNEYDTVDSSSFQMMNVVCPPVMILVDGDSLIALGDLPFMSKDNKKNNKSARFRKVSMSAVAITVAGAAMLPMPAMAEEVTGSESQEHLNNGVNELQQARDIVSDVQKATEAVKSEEANVKDNQGQLDTAQAALKDAASNLANAQNEYQSALKGQTTAQNNLNGATTNLNDAEAVASNNQKAVDDAQAAVDGFDQEAANQAVDKAQAALENAQDAVSQAQDAYNDASGNVDAAQADVNASSDDVEQKKADLKKAEDDLKKAETSMPSDHPEDPTVPGGAAVAEAKKKLDEAKQKQEAASNAHQQAQGEKDKADAARSKADDNVKSALMAQDAAQADADSKKAAADNADKQIAKGSLGFFESRGSTEAVKVLTDKSANANLDAVKLGQAGDATSLENMKKALEWVHTTNDYRAKHNLPALSINDTLMAMAQANADWSSTNYGHAKIFNVSENLAWGYANPVDPWYAEKNIYDAAVKKDPSIASMSAYELSQKDPSLYLQVGHYLNIINPEWTITGVGTNTTTDYKCDSEVFLWPNKSYGKTQTVNDYINSFNTYYDGLKQAPAVYQEALKKLNEATSHTNAAKSELLKAMDAAKAAAAKADSTKQAYDAASADVAAAQKAYDEAVYNANYPSYEQKLQEAKAARDNAQKALDTAKTKLTADQAKLADAKKAQSDASGKLDAAKAAVSKAQTDLDTAKGNADASPLKQRLEAAKKTLAESQKKVDELQSKVDQFTEALKTEQARVSQAKAVLDDAQTTYNISKSNRDSAKAKLDKANERLTAAKALLKELEQKRDEAVKAEQEEKDRLDSILNKVEESSSNKVEASSNKVEASSVKPSTAVRPAVDHGDLAAGKTLGVNASEVGVSDVKSAPNHTASNDELSATGADTKSVAMLSAGLLGLAMAMLAVLKAPFARAKGTRSSR